MNKFIFHVYFGLLFFVNIMASDLKVEVIKEPIYGPITKTFLTKIKNAFQIDTFVETGTFLGYTTRNAAAVFNKVHTVELSKEVHAKAVKNLKEYKNVELHQGDSVEIFKTLLKHKLGKILFWLDGHYSGVHFGQQTAKGNVICPLIQELDVIKASGIVDSVIMVDDVRLFDIDNPKITDETVLGYPKMKDVCSKLLEINPKYSLIILGDTLIAFDNKNIKLSEALKACSISRISGNLSEILNAEKSLVKADKSERKALEALNNWFAQGKYFKEYGIGNYYDLWHSIILLNEKKHKNAKEILSYLNQTFDKKRIRNYLTK